MKKKIIDELVTFEKLAKINEDIRDELDDWLDKRIQIIAPDGILAFLIIKDRKVTIGEGRLADADEFIRLTEKQCRGIIAGTIDILTIIFNGEIRFLN